MAFKALFLAHAPDADYKKHHSVIDTGRYRLFTYIVKTQDEAIEVSKSIYEKEKITSILLCPGFTHGDVSGIVEALEGKVAVCVARGDGPGNKITQPVIQKEFFNELK